MTRQRTANLDAMFPRRKGPNGERLCRRCGKPLTGRRLSWCSDDCQGEALARCYPADARWRVRNRDHGICARCGFDCMALDEAIRDFAGGDYWCYDNGAWFLGLATADLEARWKRWDRRPYQYRCPDLARHWLWEVGLGSFIGRSTWEAHHIVAVRDGGGLCGLDNYETLCWRCHPQATRAQNRKRKGVMVLPMGEMLGARGR